MGRFYIFILFLSGLNSTVFSVTSDLIISEYGEGSSGNSKYIELFNGTGASINLANYRIWTITNGGSWPEATLTLSGTLADGATYVIANNSTDVPGSNLYSGTCSWNGDDAVGLAKNIAAVWTLIDAVGSDGADPGTGWAVAGTANGTVDKRLTRKSTVCSPNINWSASAGTTALNSEWTLVAYTTGAAVAGHTASCSGIASEIQLQQPVGTDNACGFIYDFSSQIIGSNTDVTIRIQNIGTGTLNIDSTRFSGTNASEFSLTSAPSVTVVAGSYTDITVRFSPAVPGNKSTALTLYSNDGDESACVINFTASASYTACSALIISEYGEPLVGNAKYIELFNGTSSSINLANYRLQKISNGSTVWPGTILALSGTLATGQTYVIANNSTDNPVANLYDATFCNWNGNDALALAANVSGTWYVIDAIGVDNFDPGTGWNVAGVTNATANHTLVRKTSVTTPNANWPLSAGTTVLNSEWYVRAPQLNNVSCHINSCNTTSAVGFDLSTSTVTESNTTVTVNITMNSVPSTNVTVTVTDALLGTASSGTDYTAFTPINLSFTTAEIYPNTKTVSITISDDLISESNENIVLNLDAQCGALISNGFYSLTIIDNEVPEGIIINEFAQGSNEKEYVELIVTGIPGTTIDLRGWIIDDNSGIFSGGYGTNLGIAPGHLKFSDICTWEKVPVGSIILIYNATDKNPSITVADDPTDGNLDYLYVIGIESYSSCASSTGNSYFSSDCIKPNNTSYDQYTPAVYTNADWNTMQFRNAGDAIQVRSSIGGFFHGISYGNKASSDCGLCDLILSNHPDYSVYGVNALYFSFPTTPTSAILRTYEFENTNTDDYRDRSNWNSANTVGAIETPGTFNSVNNQTWILSLRNPFGVVLDNQSYTCNLRAFESRYYLDGIDSIIYWIKNNISTDHGSFTAQTILHDDATPGNGFQNTNLLGMPLFLQKTYTATPTSASPSNYKIRFYVSNQELQDYCDYINPILNAIPGYYTNHLHTPAEVISHLKIYRTSTTDRAWTVTTDAQVQIVNPAIGTYGAYTTFEYDGFTGFSGYALGDVVTPDIGLPVELINFDAKCSNGVVIINWTTASEKNADYFEIERSDNGIHFTALEKVYSIGESKQILNYKFTDQYPLSGINYYRLKQQDKGNIPAVYSPLITAKCKEDIADVQTFLSSESQIKIQLNSETAKDILFKVYEISGKLIYQENKPINKGFNNFSLNFNTHLSKGIYIVQVIDGSDFTYEKIVVK